MLDYNMSISPQWLDDLRSRTTLSALIGRTTRVQKAGREWKACCPFHNEKTPSFTINDEKGFYHCFGCGAHGDAIKWMTDQRGLSFMDAVKELATEAGMDVPAADPKARKQAEKRASLYDVMAAAQDFFVQQLDGIEGAVARTYLDRRGMKAETIARFGFGYAPNSRIAIKAALKQFDEAMLIEAGLLITVEDKAPYDRFRGRLMIPIRDARGRVIAFGGRILGDGEPKYLNSPDTPLFDKGRTLYNQDKASPASRQTGRIIVCEGYMDVIALAQAGLDDAVAPLGTALTEQQIQMLWRMTEKPLLCFDGDAAGQKAAMRAAVRALPLLKPGHSLQFVTLPEGKDPDDLVKSEGPATFKAILDAFEPMFEYLWQHEFTGWPLDTPEDRAGLKARLGVHLANIADGEIRRHYADAFRERFDRAFAPKPRTAFQWQQRNVKDGRVKNNFRPPLQETRAFSRGKSDLLLGGILAALIRDPAQTRVYQDMLSGIKAPAGPDADILERLLNASWQKETLDPDRLPTILGEKLYNRASELLTSEGKVFCFTRVGSADNGANSQLSGSLAEAIRLMQQRPALEKALESATRKAQEELTEENFAEQQKLRKEKTDFDRRLTSLMQASDVT